MTIIRISQNARNEIRKLQLENEPVDETLKRLFEQSQMKTYKLEEASTGVRISEEVYAKLVKYKAYPTEPFSSVIIRLIEQISS